ncbi:MAG: N-acetylneuraminate synthase family protein [Elusimicrobiota bacterium]
MRITFYGNPKKIAEEIKKIDPKLILIHKNREFLVKNFKAGYVYNIFPRLENIKGVKKIEAKNHELLPLVYSYKYRFKYPINPLKKIIIAGPCVIDDWDIFIKTGFELKKLGVDAIRAPLFKPRSSPYGWEGFGKKGISKLKEARKKLKVPFVMEVMDYRVIDKLTGVCDIIQIGARNMKNYVLLKEAAASGLPVLLKRQPKSNLREFLYSAEYILKYGAKKIILCERGDNLSDGIASINLEIIKRIKKELKIPIIADLSHSAKDRKKVINFAAKTAGISDGVMVETSITPEKSLIDTKQIIDIETFKKVMNIIR